MNSSTGRPDDTREFLVMWNAATEAHLAHRLTDILKDLVGHNPQTVLITRDQCAVLAPFILRALHAASLPNATVEDGVQFLAAAAQSDI
jgi:hypothetical protein